MEALHSYETSQIFANNAFKNWILIKPPWEPQVSHLCPCQESNSDILSHRLVTILGDIMQGWQNVPVHLWKKALRCTGSEKVIYEVCSKSIRIGIVVVVHWVGCVCNQSWHVRTCLSNSWHKLQVAAFAQLAVLGRGSNTCIYVTAIFTMCESTEQHICITFSLKSEKPNENVSIIAASIGWRCNGSYTSVWLVPSIRRG